MDELIGRVTKQIDDETLLMVVSDHGFKSFSRCVNLNAWLHQNGYLALKSGKTEVLNGPYAETREQLGGYFLIDVPDLDVALSWAARCPGASHGVVEVRPIWQMGES